MLCRAKKCTVVRNGKIHTPTSQPFEVDDASANKLFVDGIIEIVNEVQSPELSSVPMDDLKQTIDGDATFGESSFLNPIVDDHEELIKLSGITDSIHDVLLGAGIHSVTLLAATSAEKLVALKGIGSTKARRLIEEAQKALSKRG